MKNQNFTVTILVDQTPQEAFQAINNVRAWWSEDVAGNTDQLNSVFDYHYKDVHRCKMKIVERVPGQLVVWEVLDNYFSFTEDKSEWKGNRIVFDISEQNGKTTIRFTHEGLAPDYECYQVCHDAWTTYIKNSLRNLIATGKGQPNLKEAGEEAVNARIAQKWGLEGG